MWNYRLFKQATPKAAPSQGDYLYFVAECYYDEKGEPKLHSTINHNHVCGSSPKETEEAYKMIGEAFKAPVIELDKRGNFKK